MIVLDQVRKRYRTEHGVGKWVLHGVTQTIPKHCNVGLIGRNGAGKSTLLRIIGGVDQPTSGRVERHCRVSWPLGLGGGLQGSLSGRQNAKFVCRLLGHEDDVRDRLEFIKAFSELNGAFDEPVKTYSAGMGGKLRFAISLAFDFEIYLVDELTAVGDAAFRKKARDAFVRLADRAGLIMVAHDEKTLKDFCQAAILLREGYVQWFDDVADGLAEYKKSLAL